MNQTLTGQITDFVQDVVRAMLLPPFQAFPFLALPAKLTLIDAVM